MLGIFAHSSLALGMILLALSPEIAVDLNAYLFGDILAVSSDDLMVIYLLVAVILMMLWLRWRVFLLITINEEVARIQGIHVEKHRLILMLMLAVTVAISIKLVGLLLITSMLILPAATARFHSRSPAQMVFTAWVISLLMVVGGLYVSYVLDAPTGPAMVLMSAILFFISYIRSGLRKRG
jgi:zinc transport system permease protein